MCTWQIFKYHFYCCWVPTSKKNRVARWALSCYRSSSVSFSELAVEVPRNGKHGIEMIRGAIDIFLLLFADIIILLSSTPVSFHNQLNHVKNEADRLYLSVNFDKTNNMVFSMGGHLAVRERWVYGNKEVKVTNAYTYLGMEFTTKLCINLLLDAYASKSKLIPSFVVNGQKG